MEEFIIIGDTEKFKDCLVCLAGKTEEAARAKLDKLINNPDENQKRLKKGHYNFRIEKVKSEDCWWNDPFLAN